MNSDEKNLHRYDDIICLEHHVSKVHKSMPRIDRAAQFAPFAALTGYNACIDESARLTDAKYEPDEDTAVKIDSHLQILCDMAYEQPFITVTYFMPDERKSGGKYISKSGNFRRIDESEHRLVMTDGTRIAVDDIYAIEGDVFREFENN